LKTTETVAVILGGDFDRSYKIVIKPNAFSELAETFSNGLSSAHVVIITDEIVGRLYLQRVVAALRGVVRQIDSIVLACGEETKSIDQCAKIWNQLLSLRTDRSSTIVALGGGVIGDLAGFAAATFGRGLNVVQIPTTLLAQVDSSIGGKVGINLPQAKNAVGAFWHPRQVLIDPVVLQTLDERNYRSGLAEVVKYGVIMDRSLFEMLESHVEAVTRREPQVLKEIIASCCRCKAQVVQQDERELTGTRAILNYGHTLGHAIEAVTGYGTYLHGEAVAIGMHFAGRLACEIGWWDHADWQRQASLLQAFALPIFIPAGKTEELLKAMRHDKKVVSGALHLVLPKRIGQAQLMPAPSDELIKSIIQELATQ
jgi:3-dehydroquinate synthase